MAKRKKKKSVRRTTKRRSSSRKPARRKSVRRAKRHRSYLVEFLTRILGHVHGGCYLTSPTTIGARPQAMRFTDTKAARAAIKAFKMPREIYAAKIVAA